MSDKKIERCPTCRSTVTVEGDVTRYYMPVDDPRISELERALTDALVYCESGLPVPKIRGERWRKLLERDYEARKPK